MSRQHYFYNTMRKTIVQFLDMFNDIVIARYNQDTGEIIKYVKVPLKFAPKTKQWYWEELRKNKDRRDFVLPMMAVQLENAEYSADRQVNRNAKIELSNDGTDIKQYFNPVPYDFTFSLQIAAETMVDITQIVEQIFPYFTPEAYIRVTIPELKIDGLSGNGESGSDNLELRVLYESSTKEAPVDIDEAAQRVLMWTLTFRVQGYLFSPIFDGKAVHHVVQQYYTSDEAWANRGDDVDVLIGDTGNAAVQGHTYATDIPPADTPVDDDVRALYDYERFGD